MKIGLLTTIDVNIGDDFIRTGIQHLLARLKQQTPGFVIVNKHRPLNVISPTFFSAPGPSGRLYRFMVRLAGPFASRYAKSVFDDCDLLIQCGTPIMWHGCSRSEWAEIIWRGAYRRRSAPLLNLAGGSCYAWAERDSVNLLPADKDFIKYMGMTANLTTVRDAVAQGVFAELGVAVDLLPCTAFLAAAACESTVRNIRQEGDIDVVFNFMPGGGHFDFDSLNLHCAWEERFREVYRIIKGRGYRTGFVCHSNSELKKAAEIDASVPAFFPKSPQEYFARMAGVKAAFVNRLHAAVGLGGAAIPCIAVGSDTRMLMVREFAIPCLWVAELPEAKIIADQLESMMDGSERNRLLQLRHEVENKYLGLISTYVNDRLMR